MADGGELARQRGVHDLLFYASCVLFLQGVWDGYAWMSTKALGCCTGEAGDCFPWAWGLPLCKHDGLAMGRKHGVSWGLPGWQQKAGKRGMSLTLPVFLARRIMYVCSLLRLQQRQRLIVAKIVFTTTNTSSQCPTTRAAYRDVPERRDCT